MLDRVGEQLELSAEHIGGIDDTDVTFQPSVTDLTGYNATNRTSLLQVLMGALGSDAVLLKGECRGGTYRADSWR
jgi:predicted ATP-dependent endonuclease of OLD family